MTYSDEKRKLVIQREIIGKSKINRTNTRVFLDTQKAKAYIHDAPNTSSQSAL